MEAAWTPNSYELSDVVPLTPFGAEALYLSDFSMESGVREYRYMPGGTNTPVSSNLGQTRGTSQGLTGVWPSPNA